MMSPGEQQAFLNSVLAYPNPGEGPSSIAAVEAGGALPAGAKVDGAPVGPAPGIAGVGAPQPGLGMDAPPVGTQKIAEPYKETTTTTPTLDPRAIEAEQKVQAAEAKRLAAEQMNVPIKKVQPFMPPEQFEAMKAAGQTAVNYGQFQDLAKDYATRQEAQAEADFAKAEAERAAANQKELDRMMGAAQERWDRVADLARPENMMPSPSFATKLVQAIARGLSTYANIRAGHGGPSPVDVMLDQEANREYQQKRDQLAAAKEAAEKAGQAPRDFRVAMLEQDKLKEQRRADLYRAAALQARKMAEVFPAKQRELEMQAAELEKKGWEAQRDLFVKELTRKNEQKNVGEKVERVEQLEGGSGKQDGTRGIPTTADEYTNAEMMAKKAERGKELMKNPANIPTGKDLWEARNRQMQYIANLEAEKHGAGRVFVNDMLRGAPGFPDSIYPSDWSEEKKELVQLANENAHMVGVRRYGQTGMGGEHYIEFMGVMLGQPGESEKAVRQKYEDLFDQSILNAENYRRLTKFGNQEDRREAKAARTAAASQATPTAAAKPSLTMGELAKLPKAMREDYAAAVKVKQGSPDYEGAQAAIRTIEAEARKKGGK